MALAYAQYLGNGSNRNFNVTFPFISKDHVKVRVGGELTPFTWLAATTIELPFAPENNVVVDVRRVTPRDRLLVDFKDASVLVETDLDLSALQVFYLSQEAFDLGEASLGVTEDGSYSALNRRISNVLDPAHRQDVTTKNYVDTAMTSQVQQATNKANEAAASAAAALASKNAAATSVANADASKNTATTKATEASNSATAAANSASASAASAATAGTHKDNAGASATAAASSAAAAAASAAAASMFDPASYDTRTVADGKYAAKVAPKVTGAADFVDTLSVGKKDATRGYLNLRYGGATQTGYMEFLKADNVRLGYVGYLSANNRLMLNAEGDATGWEFNTNPYVGTNVVYHAGNLNAAVVSSILGYTPVNPGNGLFTGEVNQQVKTLTVSGGNVTIDLSEGNRFRVVLTANATLQVTNLPTSGQVQDFIIEVVQDGTGGRTLAASGTFAWPGEGTIPSITTTANATNIIAGYATNSRAVCKFGGSY